MIELGSLRLDPAEFGSQGSAVLGIRDSGKTYTATLIAERMYEAGIPFIAFDPIGVWRFLRVPGQGKGYPIVVAGGEEPDIPLTPANAAAIVEAAMQQGVSLVIDLFDMKLSKADWKRIVRDCVNLLLHKNKQYGLRHVFLEEAAEFAPQKVSGTQGEVYAAVEKLARMGGNSRLGYTLINQRSQEVNKAVLELCDNLFLHRQRGLNSLANLKKWLDVAGATAGEVMGALPTLPQGECFAWIAGSDTPVHLKVPAKNSLHPDRRVTRDQASASEAKKSAVNVDKFVDKLRGQLESLDAEMKANDPSALKAEVARLKRELAAAQKGKGPAYPDLRDTLAATKADAAHARAELAAERKLAKALERKIEAAAKALGAPVPAPVVSAAKIPAADIRRIQEAPASRVVTPAAPPRLAASPGPGADLPLGERAILIAVVQYNGVDRDQLSVLTGYKRSTRDAYIQRLREKGLVTVDGKAVRPVEPDAVDALGDSYEPLPEGEELQAYWREKLPAGEWAVLGCLIGAYPEGVPRDEISEATGYKRSTRDAYIQRLKVRRLAQVNGASVLASATLF